MSKQWWGGFQGYYPWAGMGFGRQRFFEAGELRLAILSLLSEGPKHGYQLMKEMQDRSGGAYRASAGSVYPTLQQLEDEGMVQAEMQSGRRVYRLTEEGRKELERDPIGVRRIWERAERCEDWGQFMGPETFSILPSVSILVRASMRAAGRGSPERVREILDRARRDIEEL
jgi:DNA-binding PadR family transcriptional regulator